MLFSAFKILRYQMHKSLGFSLLLNMKTRKSTLYLERKNHIIIVLHGKLLFDSEMSQSLSQQRKYQTT